MPLQLNFMIKLFKILFKIQAFDFEPVNPTKISKQKNAEFQKVK